MYRSGTGRGLTQCGIGGPVLPLRGPAWAHSPPANAAWWAQLFRVLSFEPDVVPVGPTGISLPDRPMGKNVRAIFWDWGFPGGAMGGKHARLSKHRNRRHSGLRRLVETDSVGALDRITFV